PRLELGQVAEVVVEPGGAAAVEPGPEGRLADRGTLGVGHALVVVGGPGDHVDVRVDVLHGRVSGELRSVYPSRGRNAEARGPRRPTPGSAVAARSVLLRIRSRRAYRDVEHPLQPGSRPRLGG